MMDRYYEEDNPLRRILLGPREAVDLYSAKERLVSPEGARQLQEHFDLPAVSGIEHEGETYS